VIALGEAQCAIVAQSFEVGFNSHLGIVRRALAATIEVDIEFNLQAANIFFESHQMVFDREYVFENTGLLLIAALLGAPG
jgi:hypothetical protein